MNVIVEIVASAMLLVGTLFITVSVFGTLRWRDLDMRNHAAGKGVVMGVIMVLGAAIGTGDSAVMRRALLVGLILLLTAPVSAHLIGRANHRPSKGPEPE